MPYVLVQEEGGYHPLMEWFVADTGSDSSWDGVCQMLVAGAFQGKRALSVNVFVVFDQEDLASRAQPALEALIDSARSRTWGASLLLVLANPPSLAGLRSSQADLAQWLRKALSGRVEDLLEISELVNRRAPDRFLETLRDRASATKARREALKTTAGRRAWRCVLPRERLYLSDFLGPAFLARDDAPEATADTVVVLSDDSPEEQIARLERYLDTDGSGCRVVTYVHEPAIELRQFCNGRGLPDPIDVRGDFELWYLLLRLNECAREHLPEDSYSVHPVRLSPNPPLMVMQPEDPPVLLVTSVFDQTDVAQWLIAANEVGEILHRIPFGMKRRVEMGATPERLTSILEDMQVALVWIHIGHGEGRNGLRVPGDESVGVERWIQCFSGRNLRLALFLTCHSDDVARRFAREGASVAIGFLGEVESDKTWHLAVEVVKAIVAEGTHGGTILAGFGAGLPRFEAAQKLDAHARAYYPRQT